ncbi:hypothetical protein [Priestia koreensis]|uniref:hypothetical protein n=1 Tax=Priestia koreensis TaxID=284581 RepID=UPI001F57C802|nr:hypothetical protein [Priestia koreensis]UNL83175.1 hypothetical protein IE339_13335 [Priestia koreensis]
MRDILLYLISPLLAFVGGFCTYVVILKVVYDETLVDGTAVLIWGSLIFLAICMPLYTVIIYAIDKRFTSYKGLLYPLGCMLLFAVPTAAIMLIWGDMNPFLSEALLFHSFFIMSGLIFGLCHWVIKKMPPFSDSSPTYKS